MNPPQLLTLADTNALPKSGRPFMWLAMTLAGTFLPLLAAQSHGGF